MSSVGISSYGCAREVWRARIERSEATAESNSSFLSALQTSQVHPYLDIRTAKSMNRFFYNMASTNWALKHVFFLFFFLIDYKVPIMHGEAEKQRSLGS